MRLCFRLNRCIIIKIFFGGYKLMRCKALYEMTIEELRKLFPISLHKHNSLWKDWFCEEKERIISFIGDGYRISHIGSTAIADIMAKNIVDILVEAHDPAAMEKAAKAIEQNGYIKMSEGNNRKSFNRGYTVHGFAEKVFHLHLRLYGDNNELYFRDYLIEHAGIAREYEKLKLSLWKKHEFNRDAYTAAKTEFVLKYTLLAKENYKNRY